VPDLVQLLEQQGVREQALVVLVGAVVALVLLSFAFAGYTFLLRLGNRRRELRKERLKEKWEEPLLLALADPDRTDALHQLVADDERLYFVQFVLDYARRVRGAERTTLEEIVAPYLGPITERASDPRREIRTRAVQTLGELGLPAHADLVVAALDDPSPLVAMVAARSLAARGQVERAPDILQRLHRFEGWSVGFMASLLASMGAEGAPALRETLADRGAVARVRGVAAQALSLLADLDSADLAARIAREEEDPELLRPTLQLLARVGRPEHVEVVRQRCASPDATVRATALRALGTLADDDDRVRLLGAMADPSPWVAMSAARGLLEGGGDALLRDLAGSDHPRAMLAAEVLEEEGPS
jgi:HEAT repeat protein